MAFPWIRWSCSFRCLRILLWRNTILPSTRSTITTTIRTTMMPSASASVSAWAWQNCVESNSSEAITIMFLLMIIIYIVYGCKYTAFLWHIQVFTVRKHYRFSTFCYQNVWFIVVIWNKSCNFAIVKWQEMIQIDEKNSPNNTIRRAERRVRGNRGKRPLYNWYFNHIFKELFGCAA